MGNIAQMIEGGVSQAEVAPLLGLPVIFSFHTGGGNGQYGQRIQISQNVWAVKLAS